MRLKILFLFLTALAWSSCVTDVANRYYLKENYSAKDTAQVEVLRGAPQRAYVIIADFQSRGDTIEGMRRRAAKIGADAVIVQALGGLYSKSEEWAGNDSMSNTYSRITATAIKYK